MSMYIHVCVCTYMHVHIHIHVRTCILHYSSLISRHMCTYNTVHMEPRLVLYMYNQSQRQGKCKQQCPKPTLFFQRKRRAASGGTRTRNALRSRHTHVHVYALLYIYIYMYISCTYMCMIILSTHQRQTAPQHHLRWLTLHVSFFKEKVSCTRWDSNPCH